MNKKNIEINVERKKLEYLEALYYDYRAKQDLLNSIFELHKFDEDDSIITSVPFKVYEKAFAEAKVKYDHAMKEIQNTYIPQEVREAGCHWEVNFDEYKIIVTPM